MNQGFGVVDYVPVLRWKAAEVNGLLNLSHEIKPRVLPLIELCPSMFLHKKKNKRGEWIVEIRPIDYLSEKLIQLDHAIGNLPFYLDMIHANDGQAAYTCKALWNSIIDFSKSSSRTIVPVTDFYGKGIPYQNLVGSVAHEFGNGACVRLFSRDIFRNSLDSDLQKLLRMLNLIPGDVDIIIDLQMLKENGFPYSILMEKLPILDRWRSITLLAGSFPKDLGYPMKANNTYKIPRLEWSKWESELLSGDTAMQRQPRFGDYTIQHPFFSEPPQFPNVSASIRYTCDQYWIDLRGEALGKKCGIGAAQYSAEAQLIVDKSEYSGEYFSFGDKFIMEKSRDENHPGNPTQWLMAAFNHHITYTMYQIHTELQIPEQKEAVPVSKENKTAVPSLM